MGRKYKGFTIIKTEIKQVYKGKNITRYLYKVFDINGSFNSYLSQYKLKETKEYIDNHVNT